MRTEIFVAKDASSKPTLRTINYTGCLKIHGITSGISSLYIGKKKRFFINIRPEMHNFHVKAF
jgi:hypothetical protein